MLFRDAIACFRHHECKCEFEDSINWPCREGNIKHDNRTSNGLATRNAVSRLGRQLGMSCLELDRASGLTAATSAQCSATELVGGTPPTTS